MTCFTLSPVSHTALTLDSPVATGHSRTFCSVGSPPQLIYISTHQECQYASCNVCDHSLSQVMNLLGRRRKRMRRKERECLIHSSLMSFPDFHLSPQSISSNSFSLKLEQSCFTTLCWFLLYSKVNQPHVYIYPLFLGFLSHLGQHRAMSRVPCAVQSVLISYLFYTQQCIYVNPNLPMHPSHPSPLPLILNFTQVTHYFGSLFCTNLYVLCHAQQLSRVLLFATP